jgi:peptidoglycan/LPS O-acetylase OafA/YrhL
MHPGLDRTVRLVAVAAAALSALLYALIGMGVLFVGEATAEGGRDILTFGVLTGGAFAFVAVLLALSTRRAALLPVAAFTLLVIVGYFALAEQRDPPFAPWGLVVKAVQVVLIVAVGALAVRPPPHASNGGVRSGAASASR